MSRPVLVGVAHGSHDPAAQRTARQLLAHVAERSGVPVAPAFVQNAEPSLPAALAQAGPGAVVVPLLLSRGYHLSVDIARAARAADAVVVPPLGPDPALTEALAARLAEAGAPAGVPVVLAAAGSSDPRAQVDVERQAAQLGRRLGVPVVVGYASAASPTVGEAVAALSRETGSSVAVATYLLGPGYFADAVARVPARWVALPLGAHDAVVGLVLARYGSVVPAGLQP
ncbi:MAG TPA: CbiX/SirB N-terminal domain-containing protein [Kineosporiaceae bacterium]|nr:CbiX/SirB N-terminal domain-containing protein [Kineosporiaceae bacterium]